MKKRNIITIVLTVLLCGCGKESISKEEYDRVVSERDGYILEISEMMTDGEKAAMSYFSEYQNVSIHEINSSILGIVYNTTDDNRDISDFAEKLAEFVFYADYDYILLDVWEDSIGRTVSWTIGENGEILQDHTYLGSEK